jgi:hypothetical protein
MRGRAWRALLCAVAVIGLGLLGGIPAATAASGKAAGAPVPRAAIPHAMSALAYHRMIAQIPLDRAVTRIRAAVTRPGAGHAGFVEVWVNDDRHLVTVYWHGRVPADIQRLFASLRRGIGVRVAPARYSGAQLARAVSRVLHARSGVHVTGAGPLPDGSGIVADVAGPLPGAGAQRLFGAGVAVHLVRVPPAAGNQSCVPNPGDTLSPPARCYDLQAYWGGAVIENVTASDGCSSGFGVHSTIDGKDYMLTAGHCGNVGDTIKNGNETATLGQITHRNLNHDDAMISTLSGNAYYDGPGVLNGDTHNSKIVAGQQPTAIGDWLCVSGSRAGTICSVQVTCLNQVVTTGGFTSTRVAEARFRGGGQTLPGDSGGPLFSLAASNKVTAKGIHKGLWPDCIDGETDDMFQTIDWVSADFSVTVNTG